MLRINARCQYGLRALLYLARRAGQGRVRVAEIARETGTPVHFLEQILVTLRRAGLVRIHRGAAGGCELADPPAAVTVARVVEALEGRCRLLEKKERNEALAQYWRETEAKLHAALGTTLQDLAASEDALARNLNYVI